MMVLNYRILAALSLTLATGLGFVATARHKQPEPAPADPLAHEGLKGRAHGKTQEAKQGAAPADPEGYAGRAIGPIAGKHGLLAGDLALVTFADLDEILIWRDGRSSKGEIALRQLLELRTLSRLAEKQGIVITNDALLERYQELDAAAREEGNAGGLAGVMKTEGVDPIEFRELLRLSMIFEQLTRTALHLKEGAPVTGDQQELWLEETMTKRGFKPQPHPWTDGIVCTSGDITITRAEFGAHLRKQVSADDRKEAIYLILLERAVRARMPSLTDNGVEAAIDRELERRTQQAESDPRYQGAPYEQLLGARGLSIESLRRDPAIRAAALANQAVDRANDDEALRAIYAKEREYYDGLFGESVEVHLVFKHATEREGDPLLPSFTTVEKELGDLAVAIGSPTEFLRVVEIHSEDRATRDNDGLIGRITRGMQGVPKPLRTAVFDAVEAATKQPGGSVEGKIVGPIRMENGVIIALLTNRRPAPVWKDMKKNIHNDLRRKFLEGSLMRASVMTYLDQK